MLERYIYLWWQSARVRRFLARTRQSRRIQRDVLWTKLRRNQDSDFGREHGFRQIRTIAEFRRQLPISTYEYYRNYIERVKQGETQAMFGPGTRLLMFALTSGTTSSSKYIPITEEYFREYRASWQIWGLRTYLDHRDLVRKQTLQLSSDWRQSLTSAGIPCGNISGLAAETRPWIAKPMFIIPRELIRIRDPFVKHYTALRLALASTKIGLIVTANPSTLVELARLADREREHLVRDIASGTLAYEPQLPEELRSALRPYFGRRDPARARQLEQTIEQHGKLYPHAAWPELSVLAVWTGGPVSVYLPQLEEYYGRCDIRDHGLSASEGRMTIPLSDRTSAGVLDYAHHYFEFVPEHEHDQPDPTVLEAHELEEGKSYYILLTTSSGLYRYDIHDVVRCVGFEGETPVLEFLNKGSHFSSITGEKLSEYQVVAAVQRACEQLGRVPAQFTVAPVMDEGRPKYLLLLEPDEHLHASGQLAAAVDDELQALNWEYGEKRKSGRLRPLEVGHVRPGTWASLREQRIAARGNFEEYKHRCLVGDLDFAQQVGAVLARVPAPHRTRAAEGVKGGDSPI